MKILHLSTSDVGGGAARATYRLHSGLRVAGIDSTMFVLDKRSSDPSVVRFQPPEGARRVGRLLRRERLRRAAAGYTIQEVGGWSNFSDDRTEFSSQPIDQLPRADIVHLHWISGFIDLSRVLSTLDSPIVWTAHDMNPFTGGCHYDGGCGRYAMQCGRCPVLGSGQDEDASRDVWRRKSRLLGKIPDEQLHVIVSSGWMAQRVRESSLVGTRPVIVVPNGIETTTFAPRDPALGRRALDLPLEARIVMFVADRIDDPRKGFSSLLAALANSDVPDLLLAIVGGGPADVPQNVRHRLLGRIPNDSLLALAYSAADVVAAPSLQEAMGATALEALACGTPVVGFDTGGIGEIVRPGVNGALAPVGDSNALREAIRSVLFSPDLEQMSRNARQIAEKEYDIRVQVDRQIKLYGQVC